MPATPAIQIANGPGAAGHARRGQASTAGTHCSDVSRVTEARDKLATLLAHGELWALPLFTRLEAELAQLTERDDILARARRIAEMAALKRAA